MCRLNRRKRRPRKIQLSSMVSLSVPVKLMFRMEGTCNAGSGCPLTEKDDSPAASARSLEKATAQSGHARLFFGQSSVPVPPPWQTRRRQRHSPCPAAVPFLVASVQNGRKGMPEAAIQKPDPLRAADLVGGEAHQINGHVVRQDRQGAEGLHRINVHERRQLPGPPSDFGHGLDDARLVVDPHDADMPVSGRMARIASARDPAADVGFHIGDRKPFLFQRFASMEHGMVFDGAGDNMGFPLAFSARARPKAPGCRFPFRCP